MTIDYAGTGGLGIMPVGPVTVPPLPFGYGKIFAKFTATHPTDGSLTFHWGDIGWCPDGTSTGAMVYAVVLNWDKFTKYMADNGQTRWGTVQLEIAGNGHCVASNGTKRYKISDLLHQMSLMDSVVQFYQWNERDNSQTLIWQGTWQGLPQITYPGGLMVVQIEIGPMQKELLKPISLIMNKTVYPDAPQGSIGQMIPKWYGNIISGMDTGAEVQEAVFLGYGSRFVKGVLVAENLDSLKLQYDFHRNDTTKPCARIPAGIPNDPSDPTAIWIYMPGSGDFCMVDAVDLTLTNDNNQVSALFPMEPKVWAAVHPSSAGSLMHPGFLATAYKITNDDPNDYLQTDDTNYTIALNVPALQIPAFVCTEAIVMIDVWGDPTVPPDTRTIDWGLWNVAHNAHGGTPWYFGLTGTFGRTNISIGTGGQARQRYYMQSGSPGVKQYYVPSDAKYNLGGDTVSEFNQGFLVSRDTDGSEVPLQLSLSVSSTAKSGVRLYGAALLLHGRIMLPRTKRQGKRISWGKFMEDRIKYDGLQLPTFTPESVVDTSRRADFEVLLSGWGQEDHGTQFNGTTTDAPIERGSGIAQHLLQDRGGLPVNVVSGTLGNFPDALVEEIQSEKFISPIWGPDEVTDFQTAIDALMAHHQIDIHLEDDGYHAIYDTMNPHPSQYYLRNGEVAYIEGWDIEEGSFKVSMPGLTDLVNVVALSYGHAYGSNKPLGSVQYQHPLSVDLYGARDVITYDEPWITAKDLSAAAPEPANFRARYLGRVSARRRMTVTCSLGQNFWNLKRGNVIEFGQSMEGYGYSCPAHRLGLANYAYISDSDTVNYSDSSTPKFVKASGDGAAYWILDQQVDGLNFLVVTPAGFTLTGWQYYYGPGVYDGVSWASYTNVANPNALKTAGSQRVSWTRPLASSHRKAELPLAGVTKGPGYPIRMVYTAATAQGLGSGVSGYDAKWWGRQFRVKEATRRPGRMGDYAKIDLVLEETL